MFYLTTHSTHFSYGYMASDIWLRTILIVRKETRCRHMGYSFRLTARVLLYAPSHIQDNTYHGLCYTSRGALAGTRNSSTGPPHEGSIRRPIALWANAFTTELHLAPFQWNNEEVCYTYRKSYGTTFRSAPTYPIAADEPIPLIIDTPLLSFLFYKTKKNNKNIWMSNLMCVTPYSNTFLDLKDVENSGNRNQTKQNIENQMQILSKEGRVMLTHVRWRRC